MIKKIKVTLCRAQGQAFSNLTPGSVHDVVEPPRGYKNDDSGSWVLGVGEPVRLLVGEFEEIK